MQKKWKAFTRKIDVVMDEFPTILESLNRFLCEPYTAIMNRQTFKKRWNANEGSWN